MDDLSYAPQLEVLQSQFVTFVTCYQRILSLIIKTADASSVATIDRPITENDMILE